MRSPSRFEDDLLLIVRTCRAHGKSLSEFNALPEFEQRVLLAYTLHIDTRRERFRDLLIAKKLYTPEVAAALEVAGG